MIYFNCLFIISHQLKLANEILQIMKNQEQIINQTLRKQLSASLQRVGGTSINNCIITSYNSDIAYSYFEAIIKDSKIQLQLISLKINTQNNHTEVISQPFDFQGYFRLLSKEVEEIQFDIRTNNLEKELHIIELKIKGKGSRKSRFFIFSLEYSMIESKSALPISEIMARKDIIQMHWHPLDHNIFIALTADSFATYKYQDGTTGQSVTLFKNIDIRQQIVDFCFSTHQQDKKSCFITALGESGQTYIILYSDNDSQNLTDFKLHQVLNCQNKLNWLTIKTMNAQYNTRQLTLSIKSGYGYKNNKREFTFEVYELRKDSKKNVFSQKLIAQINDGLSPFEFPFNQLRESSLFYFNNKQIMGLDLSKMLNFLTLAPKQRSQHFCNPSMLQVALITDLKLDVTKFLLFQMGKMTILRHSLDGKSFHFSQTSLDLLEFESQGSTITKKIDQIIKSIARQLQKQSLPALNEFQNNDKIEMLREQATEADIEKFLTETTKYIKSKQQLIGKQTYQINYLSNQINISSEQLKEMNSMRTDIEKLQDRIRRNEVEIKSLQENQFNDNKTDEDNKFDELQSMIDFVNNKPFDLSEQSRQSFVESITGQLKLIKQIQQRYSEIEAQLEEIK